VSPALTSVAIDIAALGARAVAQLAARITAARDGFLEGATDGADEAIVPHLVVRETTTKSRQGLGI